MNKFYLFICFTYLFVSITCQSTSDCGQTKGCFLHPEGCVDSGCSFIYKWSDKKDSTDFEITALLKDKVSVDSAWIAIGFGYNRKMGDDCVVMCQHDSSRNIDKVEHYFNVKKETPIVLDPSEPTVGLSNSAISVNNGFMTCKFNRIKKNSQVKNYFDLNNKFYALGASGAIEDGDLQFHGKSHAASSGLINFESFNIYSSEFISQSSIKIHASLGIITWILFVSSGIIIARYYKGLLKNSKPCNLKVWFFLHRPIMIAAVLLSISSFLIILSFKKWRWVYSENTSSFIHSLFGIVTLGLLCIQPLLALFRCNNDHPHRFLFNRAHFFIGITSFILSIVTIFLANFLTTFELNPIVTKILTGWSLWIVFLIITLELLSLRKNPSMETTPLVSKNTRKSENFKMKIIFLILHFLISIGTVASLLFFIFS